ncbi:MAG TPA: PQQ-binding-like beta-propeller repeat protein [Polyangiaceae bacterium]|nr:PQQ-binding-like beta-propeller repeat protein [Polyangiaceae bacterium]
MRWLVYPLLTACLGIVGCGSSSNDAAPPPTTEPEDAGEDAEEELPGEDSGPETGLPPQCGSMAGLQAGSPWPMANRCPARINRGKKFPSSAKVGWKYTPDSVYGELRGSPVVAADGAIYLLAKSGSNRSSILRLKKDGAFDWYYQVSKTGSSDEAGPVLTSQDTVVAVHGDTLYAVGLDGKARWDTKLAKSTTSNQLSVGPDGTLYTCAFKLQAFGADGTPKWTVGGDDDLLMGSAVAPDGTVFALGRDLAVDSGMAMAVSAEGKLLWRKTTKADGVGPMLFPLVRSDGTFLAPMYKDTTAWSPTGAAKFTAATFEPNGATLASGGDQLVVSFYGGHPGGYGTVAFTDQGAKSKEIELCNKLLLSDGDGAVLCGAQPYSESIIAVGADGEQMWSVEESVGLGSTAAMGADGTLYVTTKDGLIAIGP